MSVESPQPLGPADVFARGFGLWWRRAGPMAVLTLVVLVPMQLLSLLIAFITDPEYFKTLEDLPKILDAAREVIQNPTAPPPAALEATYPPPMSGGGTALVTLGDFLSILIGIIGLSLVVGACLYIALGQATGTPITWRAALNSAMDRLRAMVFLQVIAGILLFVLLVVTVIVLFTPAIWLAVTWAVALPVLLFEGLPNFEALTRSFRLVRQRWWPTFGAIVLGVITTLPIALISAAPILGWLFLDWDLIPSFAIGTLLGLIASAITHPLITAVTASIYLDLRLRKDGVVPEAGPNGEITWRGPEPPAGGAPPAPELP